MSFIFIPRCPHSLRSAFSASERRIRRTHRFWVLPQPTNQGLNGRPRKRFNPLARLPEVIESSVIRRSQVAVGLGGYVADRLPDANVATIPNGLDCRTWAPIDRASARTELGFTPDEFVVVFAGRILAEKGVDVLLEAVRLVASSIPRLSVQLLGPLSGSFDTRDETVTDYAREMMKLAQIYPRGSSVSSTAGRAIFVLI